MNGQDDLGPITVDEMMMKVPEQPREVLIQLAKDIYAGRVFTDRHLRSGIDLPMVFMVIALGAISRNTDSYKKDIGMIYEYLDKAGPTVVNGMPMFFSCHILSRRDTEVVWEKVKDIQAVIDGVAADPVSV